MTTLRRWCAVAVGVALFAAACWVVAHRPAGDSDESATSLLARVREAEAAPYSGLVSTAGTLALPVTDRFTDLGELLGGTTDLRVWWRAGDRWRVDRLLPTGENDLVRAGGTTTEWSYERLRATRSGLPDIRLPRTDDLLPPALARRLLEDAKDDEATRLPARRIAGRDALGFRVEPAAPQASVDHVDVWADRETGIALRVEVYGDARTPAFTTTFQRFSPERPAASLTDFTAPPGARVDVDEIVDLADAANRYASVLPPTRLAGLSLSSRSDGAVGVFGRGITELVAVPLWDRAAEPLREQLATTPGVVVDDTGSTLRVGPFGLTLTEYDGGGGWLLVGSVDQATMTRAAAQLVAGTRDRAVDDGRAP